MIRYSTISAPRGARPRTRLPLVSAIAVALAALTLTAGSRGASAAFVEPPSETPADQETLLQADEITYDDATDTVTAEGYVEIQRGDRISRSSSVSGAGPRPSVMRVSATGPTAFTVTP